MQIIGRNEAAQFIGVLLQQCRLCRQTKPLDDFAADGRRANKRRAECKLCWAAYKRARYAVDPDEKEKAAERHRMRTYGIDRDAWNKLFDAQQGKCPTCDNVLKRDRTTHVDHCHKTGLIRGLLCGPCNTSLGAIEANPRRLLGMAAYLEKHAIATQQQIALVKLTLLAKRQRAA